MFTGYIRLKTALVQTLRCRLKMKRSPCLFAVCRIKGELGLNLFLLYTKEKELHLILSEKQTNFLFYQFPGSLVLYLYVGPICKSVL